MWKRGSQAVSLALPLLLAGCAISPIPLYSPRPVSSYALKISQEGVTVAVEPMAEPEEQERYFTTRLSESDILPIFVAVENRSSASLLLLRFGVRIIVLGSEFEPPPLVVHSMRAITSKRSLVLHQLEANELLDVTLSPGEVASGFRYFLMRTVPYGTQRLSLEIDLTNLETRETHTLAFPFPWRRPPPA